MALKTLTQLIADIAETWGDKTHLAQPAADLIESTKQVYAQLYLDAPPIPLVAPADPNIGVFDGFDTVEYAVNCGADAGQGFFTVLPGGDGVYAISVNFTLLSTSQNQTFNLALAKTGVFARPQTFTVKRDEEFSYSQFSLTELVAGENFGAVWNFTAGNGQVDVLSAEMTTWRVGGLPTETLALSP